MWPVPMDSFTLSDHEGDDGGTLDPHKAQAIEFDTPSLVRRVIAILDTPVGRPELATLNTPPSLCMPIKSDNDALVRPPTVPSQIRSSSDDAIDDARGDDTGALGINKIYDSGSSGRSDCGFERQPKNLTSDYAQTFSQTETALKRDPQATLLGLRLHTWASPVGLSAHQNTSPSFFQAAVDRMEFSEEDLGKQGDNLFGKPSLESRSITPPGDSDFRAGIRSRFWSVIPVDEPMNLRQDSHSGSGCIVPLDAFQYDIKLEPFGSGLRSQDFQVKSEPSDDWLGMVDLGLAESSPAPSSHAGSAQIQPSLLPGKYSLPLPQRLTLDPNSTADFCQPLFSPNEAPATASWPLGQTPPMSLLSINTGTDTMTTILHNPGLQLNRFESVSQALHCPSNIQPALSPFTACTIDSRHQPVNLNASVAPHTVAPPPPLRPIIKDEDEVEQLPPTPPPFFSSSSSSSDHVATPPPISESLRCTHPGCGKTFSSSHNLSEHRQIHAFPRVRTFRCSLPGCNHRYYYKRDLQRHCRKKHSKQQHPSTITNPTAATASAAARAGQVPKRVMRPLAPKPARSTTLVEPPASYLYSSTPRDDRN